MRAWLDDALLFDGWRPQGPTEYRASRPVSAGRHTLKVEYYEGGGGATAHFGWASASCPAGQWRAEYFANRELAGGPVLSRCESQIANDWGLTGPPGVPVAADNFSVRWSGRFHFSGGGYTFVGPRMSTTLARRIQDGIMDLTGTRYRVRAHEPE